MGVTCHYINNDWKIQKKILVFRVFNQAHTTNNIYRMIKIIFQEYKIDNIIFAISFDNASSNIV